MSQYGIIYVIENTQNGNRYVGQTRMSLNKRWAAHIQESKVYSERPLYRALSKYGIDVFNVRIVQETTIDNLNAREQYWINYFDSYSNGYNATSGGGANTEISEETKDKISIGMSNIERSDEWVESIQTGLKSKSDKGDKWGFLLDKNRGNGKHASVSVKAIHQQTGETLTFNSISEASTYVNGKTGNISRAVDKKYIAYSYRWERLTDKLLKHPVSGYCKKTGELLYQFESIRAAGRSLGPSNSSSGIQKSLNHPGVKSCYKCYWYKG